MLLRTQWDNIILPILAPELTDLGKKLCGLKKWKETGSANSTPAIKADKKKRKISEALSEEKAGREKHRKKSKPNP